MEKLAILSKLAELLGGKNYAAGITLSGIILLITPSDVLNKFALADFVDEHRHRIAILTLVLLCTLSVKHLLIAVHFVGQQLVTLWHRIFMESIFQSLTDDERKTVAPLINGKQIKIPLNILDKSVSTLTEKHVITPCGSIPDIAPSLALFYSLTPAAKAYLAKHSHAFR